MKKERRVDEGVYPKFNSVQASASSQSVGSVSDCRQRYVDTRPGAHMGGGWGVEGGGGGGRLRSFGAGLLTTGRRLARRGRKRLAWRRGDGGIYIYGAGGVPRLRISVVVRSGRFCLLGFPQGRWRGGVRVRVFSPCDSAERFFFIRQ
ncbi:expressed unknown protein [Ectocarpus siliculosus]|uniref:Uncharacterized protein n=1 Tax=Ectocarpus siliculosus TaxID=2880 RepID=D7FK54_ECTSI|nr:expressed unknown protein [Ectocarpus siliculosus]|eukprot:CBJ29264.1 expressed unknown protein [Ectocarpus siliculosus]